MDRNMGDRETSPETAVKVGSYVALHTRKSEPSYTCKVS